MAERSNASVYLMTFTLELKVEGSNPGVADIFRAEKFNCIGNGRVRTKIVRELIHDLFNLDFSVGERIRLPRRACA